jgi:hypothetical protein
MAKLSSCIVDQKQEGFMAKKYLVTLTDDEREQLLAMTKGGKVAARQLGRAHILLHTHAGATDGAIAQALHIGTATVDLKVIPYNRDADGPDRTMG